MYLSNVFFFLQKVVLTVIKRLHPNKAHGHYQISIRIIQLCDKVLCKSCMKSKIFPTEWKIANVVPIYKQDDKQISKNFQPVSLLPIFGRIFELLIYNNVYSLFIESKFLSPSQPGFKQSDFCIN